MRQREVFGIHQLRESAAEDRKFAQECRDNARTIHNETGETYQTSEKIRNLYDNARRYDDMACLKERDASERENAERCRDCEKSQTLISATNHYTRETVTVRRVHESELDRLGTHTNILGSDGHVYRVKINGAVKRWKRNPKRIEVPLKYGIHARGQFREGFHESGPLEGYSDIVALCGEGKTIADTV